MLKSRLCYTSSSKNFIQIINIESKHWVCASNIHCPAGVVDVYDSKPSCSIGSQTAGCYYAMLSQVHACPPCQRSETIWTIRLWHFCHCICNSTLHGNKSRIHLLKCFEQKNISAFPLTERPRRITGKRVATTKTVKLFCVCHMPYKKDDLATPMAQCFKCMKWYHQRCVEISSIIFKDKDADFVCKLCL